MSRQLISIAALSAAVVLAFGSADSDDIDEEAGPGAAAELPSEPPTAAALPPVGGPARCFSAGTKQDDDLGMVTVTYTVRRSAERALEVDFSSKHDKGGFDIEYRGDIVDDGTGEQTLAGSAYFSDKPVTAIFKVDDAQLWMRGKDQADLVAIPEIECP